MHIKRFLALVLTVASFFSSLSVNPRANELTNTTKQVMQLKTSSDLYQFSHSIKTLYWMFRGTYENKI